MKERFRACRQQAPCALASVEKPGFQACFPETLTAAYGKAGGGLCLGAGFSQSAAGRARGQARQA